MNLVEIDHALRKLRLSGMADVLETRLRHAQTERLAPIAGVAVPVEPEWARSNWQSYAVRLLRGDQRSVMQCLLDAGISTRRGVMNAHREGAYASGWRTTPAGLTRRISRSWRNMPSIRISG